jgi:CRP-like cAMP-binding protein
MSLMDALRNSPSFSGFTEEELAPLERAMEVRRFTDGQTVIKEGERGDTFYMIVAGAIRVSKRRDDGSTMDLGAMGVGEVFGQLALIDGGRRSATCTAEGDTTLACLPRGAFTLLYEADSVWAHHFQHMVAKQLVRDARKLNQVLLEAMLAAAGEPGGASESLSYDFRLTVDE